MMNDETVYWQAGFSAGKAMLNGDFATVRFQREWMAKAESLETGADRAAAKDAFKRGYAEAAKR